MPVLVVVFVAVLLVDVGGVLFVGGVVLVMGYCRCVVGIDVGIDVGIACSV